MRVVIVPLVRYGERSWETARYRWRLDVDGEMEGRYGTMREARAVAEEWYSVRKWVRDAETGMYVGTVTNQRQRA